MITAICCSFLREAGIFPPCKEKEKTVAVKEESQRATSPLLLFPKSPFQRSLNESEVPRHRALACWGPTVRPEGRVVRTEQTGNPAGLNVFIQLLLVMPPLC